MSHSTAARRQAPEDIVAWLQRYEPRSLPIDLWRGQLRDFVIPAVLRVAPVALSSALSTVHALAHLAAWCRAQGMPLTWDVVLDPDTVERYICVGIPNWRSRGTYRAMLRRLGPLLTTKAPWEPRPEAVTRRHVAAPYSPDELEALWRDAQHQGTPARQRAGQALIALGAGAGLDGRWCTRVAAADIIRRDGIVFVRVGEPSPRPVPVLARWEGVVCDLAASVGNEFLVGGQSLAKNRASNLAMKFKVGHGHPTLSAARLRSTWLVHHLMVGTRLPELMRAAGLAGVTVLSDLLADVPLLGDEKAAAMLRGES